MRSSILESINKMFNFFLDIEKEDAKLNYKKFFPHDFCLQELISLSFYNIIAAKMKHRKNHKKYDYKKKNCHNYLTF